MAARASAQARLDAQAPRTAIEDAVRAALVSARPSLEEILSLWPASRRGRVVLRARLGADGAVSIGGRLRQRVFERESPDRSCGKGRSRNDVPVVLELDGVGSVVVPLEALRDREGSRGARSRESVPSGNAGLAVVDRSKRSVSPLGTSTE